MATNNSLNNDIKDAVGTSLNLGSSTTIDGFIDDDTMATASDTTGATSESIAAYVDNKSASQAEMEAASSTSQYVSPGRQQYHPSAAKAWVLVQISSGTPIITVSYNVSSLTDNATGDVQINLTTAFSSSDYAITAMKLGVPVSYATYSNNRSTTSYNIITLNDAGSGIDQNFSSMACGDQ